MPRENSFSDEGRSLTPDLSEEDDREREEDHDLPAPPTAGKLPERPKPVPLTTSHDATHHVSVVAKSLKSPKSFRSHFTHKTHHTERAAPVRQMTPGDRFRQTVRKVIAMHRTSHAISNGFGKIGAEPGIDPRRQSAFETYGHIRQKCLIEIIDYSPLRSSFGRMTNNEFLRFLGDEQASKREPWVRVRWINVGGISWDVISAIAIKYSASLLHPFATFHVYNGRVDMHPLALEDVLHQRGHARSKSDYYPQHLFMRVLSHTLGSPTPELAEVVVPGSSPATWSSGRTITNLPRTASPAPLDEKLGIDSSDIYEDIDGLIDDEKKQRFQTLLDPEAGGRRSSLLANKRKRAAAAVTLDQLKKGDRVNVRIAPVCIFLYRGGTVISFHPDPTLEFSAPIAARIRQRDTSLRTTADASLLVESLLDLIVDGALEVVDEYHARLNELERAVLIKPKVKTVRDLHILSGDLILHKRTLGPIKTLVYGLRRYDVDRCAALIDTSNTRDEEGVKVVGYMSHKSKIYLADVNDHMEYVLSSIDMFADMAENLINYTFNMASYDMNEVMRRLTLATIIFLPLTLLTGYFGMNFTNMWSIQHNHSDVIFWIIALPVMAIVFPIFMWNDLVRVVHYIKKKMLARNVKKEFKRD
ncbi:hypothetical protein BV25DRAFT_1912674 [Artomyces pyxidatus]|uniref:Uncharacterized protein n=1 Tax=Artomyces pyxidatus TaxID=48021 RepID=A0ACB8TDX6_9AGAM|nr:hypothetical protein BV25DRAFT_1912674 [Artomyces pyxidatus]